MEQIPHLSSISFIYNDTEKNSLNKTTPLQHPSQD